MLLVNGYKSFPVNNLELDNIVVNIMVPSSKDPVEYLKSCIKKIENHEPVENVTVFKRQNNIPSLYKFFTSQTVAENRQKVAIEDFSDYASGLREASNCFVPMDISQEYEFKEGEFTLKDLSTYIEQGLGITPSLIFRSDLKLEDKIKLNSSAVRMYNPSNPSGKGNVAPSYEDIILYDSLSPYERRIVDSIEGQIIIESLRKIKENGAYVTRVSNLSNYLGLASNVTLQALAVLDRSAFVQASNYPEEVRTYLARRRFCNTSLNYAHLRPDRFYNESELLTAEPSRRYEILLNLIKQHYIIGADNLSLPVLSNVNRYQTDLATELTRRMNTENLSAKDVIDLIKSMEKELYSTPVSDPAVTMLSEAFTRHNLRTPRIIEELTRTYQMAYGHINLTEDECNHIVESFDFRNIKLIAGNHNTQLIYMAEFVKYNNLSSAVKDLIATTDFTILPKLVQNGFIQWLNEHKDATPNDLYKIFSDPESTRFNFNDYLYKSVKELINDLGNFKYLAEKHRIENSWHIDFNAIDCCIPGRDIVIDTNKYKLEVCGNSDLRQIYSGYPTGCCQHYAGVGQCCIYDILTNPFAANMIITEKPSNDIIAQAYIWWDNVKDILVLDNIEYRPDYDYHHDALYALIAKWAENLPISNLHIGTGCNQSAAGLGAPVTTYSLAHPVGRQPLPAGVHLYTDYHATGSVARVFKQDGNLLYTTTVGHVSHKDFPQSTYLKTCSTLGEKYGMTQGDILQILSLPQFNIGNFDSQVERLASDEAFRQQVTANIISTKNIKAVSLLPELNEAESERLTQAMPLCVLYLKNPSQKAIKNYIKLNPESVTEEFFSLLADKKSAYVENPWLLYKFPTTDPEIQQACVTKEPYTVLFIHESPDMDKLIDIAVRKDPSIIKNFPDAPYKTWSTAIMKKPMLIKYAKNPSAELKKNAIFRNPLCIFEIPNRTTNDILYAIHCKPELKESFPYVSGEYVMSERDNARITREAEYKARREAERNISQNTPEPATTNSEDAVMNFFGI